MEKRIENERGEVTVLFQDHEFLGTTEYKDAEIYNSEIEEKLKEIKEIAGGRNPYAESYKTGLEASYILHGEKGLSTQLYYLEANLEEEDVIEEIEEKREEFKW